MSISNHTKEEVTRSLFELENYIDFISNINISKSDNLSTLVCKLYLLLNNQSLVTKVLRNLGYTMKSENILSLIKEEYKNSTQLGIIAYEICMRHSYSKVCKYTYKSFKVIKYIMTNHSYEDIRNSNH